jgi:putative ABC transport system permease protein
MSWFSRLRDFPADLRYGVRILFKSPGFAAVAILALALGIGANTAIFSAVDAVLLRPLPYPAADDLVIVWEDASHQSFPRNTPAPANFFDWKSQNTVFTGMAAVRFRTANLTGESEPEMVLGCAATADLFSVLQVEPFLGRAFTAAMDRERAKVVVLTYGLWQRRYGADPAIAGRTIRMNGEAYTVLGVMPPGFHFPNRDVAFYWPSGLDAEASTRGSHFLTVVARRKPGVTLERAQSEMTTIARRLETEYPETNTKIGAVVVPLRDQITGESRRALLVLLGAAACVLLIACSNLANLLLARGAERRREIALRKALGAGEGRLIRQLVTESMVLALFGGAAGVFLGYAGVHLLKGLVPQGWPGSGVAIDGRVLAFALAATVATVILFGLLPAMKSARIDLNDALKQGSRTGIGGRSQWIRGALVVSEVALAVVLLVCAGLMIQTLHNIRGAGLGFHTDHLLTFRLLPAAKYPDQQKRAEFYESTLSRLAALPGVRSAAFAGNLPFTSMGNTVSYLIAGRPDPPPGHAQDTLFRPVTRNYFSTIGAVLKEGRGFTPDDRPSSPLVTVINEHFARLHWGSESAVGARLRLGGRDQDTYTVIGVVKDLRERGLEPPMKPAVYVMAEQADAVPVGFLVMRTETDPLRSAKAAVDAVWSVDKDQPVSLLRTMDMIVESQYENRSLQMTLLSVFASLAISLASLGLFGVLSYLVTQRVREIGLRMALGATTREVAGMFVGKGLRLTSAGLAIGVVASVLVARAMRAMLYEVAPTDPSVYAVVTGVLCAVAFAACYLPARRASRLDPMKALREE